MITQVQIVCPHCNTVNRVENARLADRPKCGRCKQELFTLAPVELTVANFEKNIASNEIPVVVEFWAPWCGVCQKMAPAYQQAASQLEPRVRLAKVNTEKEPILAGRFGIRGVPTTIIFKNGMEIARQSGGIDLGTLVRWVQSYS